MKKIYIDIMIGERFYRTLPFSYNPLFPISIIELEEYVLSKCPTLKNKRFTIAF